MIDNDTLRELVSGLFSVYSHAYFIGMFLLSLLFMMHVKAGQNDPAAPAYQTIEKMVVFSVMYPSAGLGFLYTLMTIFEFESWGGLGRISMDFLTLNRISVMVFMILPPIALTMVALLFAMYQKKLAKGVCRRSHRFFWVLFLCALILFPFIFEDLSLYITGITRLSSTAYIITPIFLSMTFFYHTRSGQNAITAPSYQKIEKTFLVYVIYPSLFLDTFFVIKYLIFDDINIIYRLVQLLIIAGIIAFLTIEQKKLATGISTRPALFYVGLTIVSLVLAILRLW